MNEFDIVLISAVVVSSLVGYFKGFVKEALGGAGCDCQRCSHLYLF